MVTTLGDGLDELVDEVSGLCCVPSSAACCCDPDPEAVANHVRLLVEEVRSLRDPNLQAFYSRPDLRVSPLYWRKKQGGGICIQFSAHLIMEAGGLERLEAEWEQVP